MLEESFIKITCLATQKIADRKPSLPIIQLIQGVEMTVPAHIATRAACLGFAEIIGASSDDEKSAFNKNQLMSIGFPQNFIDKLETISITSKEDLSSHSHLSILYAFGDDEQKLGRDAADFAQLTMQARGLSLRPNSVDDLALIGNNHLSLKVIEKFKAVNLVNLSEIITNTEEDLKAIRGIGEGSVQQLVYSLGAIGLLLKPIEIVDVSKEDLDLDIT